MPMQQACALLLVVIMTVCIASGYTEANDMSEQNQVKRAGPWSLNSIGYNAGLQGLRKFFGKRDGNLKGLDSDLPFQTDFDSELIMEFVDFLKMKENGLLGPDLLRCLLEKTNSNNREK